MSSVAQKIAAQRGGAGSPARSLVSQTVAMTMAAGATVSGSITIPDGSYLAGIRFETVTAISGSPTNINARVGSAAAGQQVVADVDVKAQGHVSATIVAGFDCITPAATQLFYQLAATGGTNPAGTVYLRVDYLPPA